MRVLYNDCFFFFFNASCTRYILVGVKENLRISFSFILVAAAVIIVHMTMGNLEYLISISE